MFDTTGLDGLLINFVSKIFFVFETLVDIFISGVFTVSFLASGLLLSLLFWWIFVILIVELLLLKMEHFLIP